MRACFCLPGPSTGLGGSDRRVQSRAGVLPRLELIPNGPVPNRSVSLLTFPYAGPMIMALVPSLTNVPGSPSRTGPAATNQIGDAMAPTASEQLIAAYFRMVKEDDYAVWEPF